MDNAPAVPTLLLFQNGSHTSTQYSGPLEFETVRDFMDAALQNNPPPTATTTFQNSQVETRQSNNQGKEEEEQEKVDFEDFLLEIACIQHR